MPPKALLLLFVFYTVMAVVYSGSVNVKGCDDHCANAKVTLQIEADKIATDCCKTYGYKTGHCANFWLTSRAWCDN